MCISFFHNVTGSSFYPTSLLTSVRPATYPGRDTYTNVTAAIIFVCNTPGFIVSFTLDLLALATDVRFPLLHTPSLPFGSLSAWRLLFKDIKDNFSSFCLHNTSGSQPATLDSQLHTSPLCAFAMSYPTIQRSVTVVEKSKVSIQEKRLPVLGKENILVRVRSVALNPVDWKASWSSYTRLFGTDTQSQLIDWFLQPGSGTGADFSGDIVALGENAKTSGLKVGDVVGGIVHSANDNGAFQGQLILVDVMTVIKPLQLHRVSRYPS